MEQADFNKNFTLESLFIGFFEELTNNSTIDSYRAKSSSIRSSLKELYQILSDWRAKKIKSPDTVAIIRDELYDLITGDSHLKYGKVHKQMFQELLTSLRCDNPANMKLDVIQDIEYNIYYLITLNKDFHVTLINDIESILLDTYSDEHIFIEAQRRLNKTCNMLVSELLNSGYSRKFIIKYIKSQFNMTNKNNFRTRWNNFKYIFSFERDTEYIVVFRLYINIDAVLKTDFGQLKEDIVNVSEKYNLDKNKRIKQFLNKNPLESFLPIEIKALDHFQAVTNARNELTIILDIIHLIYPHSIQTLNAHVLVVNTELPDESQIIVPSTQIDGISVNPENYIELISKLVKIKQNTHISDEVTDKLYSCVKHLRLANEADEMEQKFLNCWIGLENIFANYSLDSSTFRRIKENLVNAHVVSYVKRNIYNLHKTISKSKINKTLSLFNKDDIQYLTQIQTYNEIISSGSEYPLIVFRAQYLKSILFNGKKRIEYVGKHEKNLERHLVRMYRIRNEIVHDAKSSYQLEGIYTNLRYYLTFILSKCVEFFSDCHHKPVIQDKIGFEDFFSYQRSILKSLKKEEYDVTKCISVPHSVNLFS
ncbi:hypothetical protein [Hymenobacter sp. APR13]|uniref:hypothetical protein n=1 Tax=Hymenobacter sp. APR13 TaxID=1356852 RepID=UPI000A788DE1|nr:hypothetical protein [Hymenobacter sp. APR13]